MTITIRIAEDADLPLLYDLYDRMGQSDDGYFEKCLTEQKAGNREILIAYLDEKPAGFCILNWAPRYSVYQRLGIPEIQDLNVVPEARQRGVASGLIEDCEKHAALKASGIGVSVPLSGSFGPAQRLYWSLGYAPDGQGVTYNREYARYGASYPVDDNLCLMLLKSF